jgi:hypothetical protein
VFSSILVSLERAKACCLINDAAGSKSKIRKLDGMMIFSWVGGIEILRRR